MEQLGTVELGVTLGGLRPGGATYDYLTLQNVGRLRWRGRWRHTKTMEHYVQEGAFQLGTVSLSVDTSRRVDYFAGAADDLLSAIASDLSLLLQAGSTLF